MLPARFRSRIHRIAVDRNSGAIELAIEVAKAFEDLSRHRHDSTQAEVTAAAKFLSKAQRSMVPIHNVAEMCAGLMAHGVESAEAIRRLREFLEESRRKVAANSQRVLPPQADMLTISRSSTVIEALSMAATSQGVGTLYVMESRPRLEGVATAKLLSERGIRCVLVADAEGPSLSKSVDVAVVGGDAVLSDGAIVNKVGTYPLALACRDAGRPLVVLAESIKLESRFDSSTWPGPEERDEGELLPRPPKGLRALNRYFDLTPPKLVDVVVHDGGVSRRNWAAAMDRTISRGIHPSA